MRSTSSPRPDCYCSLLEVDVNLGVVEVEYFEVAGDFAADEGDSGARVLCQSFAQLFGGGPALLVLLPAAYGCLRAVGANRNHSDTDVQGGQPSIQDCVLTRHCAPPPQWRAPR